MSFLLLTDSNAYLLLRENLLIHVQGVTFGDEDNIHVLSRTLPFSYEHVVIVLGLAHE